MTDRELLKRAGKAVGIKAVCDPNGCWRDCTNMHPTMNVFVTKVWNPLIDEGDALRLAVKLHIDVLHRFVGDQRVEALAPGGPVKVEYCDEETRRAATCRAIVRAAAAIGKEM